MKLLLAVMLFGMIVFVNCEEDAASPADDVAAADGSGSLITLQDIGKILGFTTLIGALVAQVPQIIAMVKSKNVDGISFNGFSIEIYSLTIQVLYFVAKEYDFLTYADLSLLLIQDYVIVALIIAYGSGTTIKEYGHVAGYLASVAAVLLGTVTKDMIVMVMQGVVLLNVLSKTTFIASMISNKDTSAMEPAGWMIFVYSNLVRVFVGYALLGDMTIVAQHAVNGLFNSAIIFLIYKYKEGKNEEEKKEEEKKEE